MRIRRVAQHLNLVINIKFEIADYVRFRRPDDVWEPPFHTILCDKYPIRIQANADPEKVCRSFINQMKQISYDQI